MWNREAVPQQAAAPAAMVPEPRVAPSLPPPAAPEPRPVQSRTNAAVTGSSIVIKGELKASEDFTIEGRLEGRIDLPDHTLTIGPGANVNAQISAKAVTILGTVNGNITAHERLDVRPGAVVEGEITCARISIQEGATFTGKVAMAGKSPKANGGAGLATPAVGARPSH
jgi:cytoskeletal protein CcmA (bactofilin family)